MVGEVADLMKDNKSTVKEIVWKYGWFVPSIHSKYLKGRYISTKQPSDSSIRSKIDSLANYLPFQCRRMDIYPDFD